MHRVFSAPEILSAIVRESCADRADLVRLACTCRAFSGPVLDTIWHSPPLWALASRMPAHMFTVEDHEFTGGRRLALRFSRGVDITSPAHLDLGPRFAHYAKRVRKLELPAARGPPASGETQHIVRLDVLCVWVAREDLFTRLIALEASTNYLLISTAHEALLLASLRRPRRFQAFCIRAWDRPEDIRLLERNKGALVEGCSSVRELSMLRSPDVLCGCTVPQARHQNRWAALTHELLSCTTQLLVLCIDTPIAYADILILAAVPTLRKLSISWVIGVPDVPAPLPDGAFAKLTTLALEDHSPRATLARLLLSLCFSHGLKECRIVVSSTINTDAACDVLSEATRHPSLQRLTADFRALSHKSQTPEATNSLTSSLRPSSRLKTLTISVPAQLPLDVTHLTNVVSLFPRLTSWRWIRRTGMYTHKFGIPMSIGTLMDVLRPWPELVELPVAIGCPTLPSYVAITRFGTHGFRMSIVLAPAADTAEVREVLAELFPRTQELGSLRGARRGWVR